MPASQRASAASFGLLVRSLIEDARFATRSGTRMTLASWMDFITSLIKSYLLPHSEEDERVLRQCLRSIAALGEMTLGERKLGFRIPFELVRSEIDALRGRVGQYLVDGVVVSSFLPMRAIPFKVIFVVGLGESAFPAGDTNQHLDLRKAKRRAGDVSAREQDKYMFLESLLCAREKLYLSYVARDALTGEPLEPSSVLYELEDMLAKGYVSEEGLERRTHRLRRYDDPSVRSTSPSAAGEDRARRLGQHLKNVLGRAPVPEDLAALSKSLEPSAWRRLRETLRVRSRAGGSSPARGA